MSQMSWKYLRRISKVTMMLIQSFNYLECEPINLEEVVKVLKRYHEKTHVGQELRYRYFWEILLKKLKHDCEWHIKD